MRTVQADDEEPASELCYIGALVAARQDQAPDEAARLLQETARVHLEGLALDRVSAQQLIALNPDFLTGACPCMCVCVGSC